MTRRLTPLAPFGIEYTFIHAREFHDHQQECRVAGRLAEAIAEEFHAAGLKTSSDGRLHSDCGAVEIASPIHTSFDQARAWYGKMMKIVSLYPLASHRDDHAWTGGGHIHVEFPKASSGWTLSPAELAVYLLNLFRDVQNRPYLNWMFNQPVDDDSAEPYAQEFCRRVLLPAYGGSTRAVVGKKLVAAIRARQNRDFPWRRYAQDDLLDQDDAVRFFNVSKGYAVLAREQYGTVELRFFDAKRDWYETALHLRFAHAYLRYIFKYPGIILLKNGGRRKSELYRGNRAVDEFDRLLGEIGLDPADYAYFVNRNYKLRKKNGWL